jgi:hypothetical protein
MKNDALEKIFGGEANANLIHSLREDCDKVTNQSMKFNDVIRDLNLDMMYFWEGKEGAQTVQVSLNKTKNSRLVASLIVW